MSTHKKILILGASYGSLLGVKLALAGHDVHLVCLPAEADLINREGAIVRMPVRGRDGLVEIRSRGLPGRLDAGGTQGVDPGAYDLVALAMQEPQYRVAGVRELLDAIAKSRAPCMSIMNMPPLPYLARIPHVAIEHCRAAYTDASVWDRFDTGAMTLCSPDPQAFRPPDDAVNVLQVRLPTNFKAARFDADAPTVLLRDLARDIEAVRFDVDGGSIELPVKLKVFDSVFVPLAKWSMLLAGNYRCVLPDRVQPIRDAVHGDIAAARSIYDWVAKLCMALGAAADDLVAFDKYAAAAQNLVTPSSAARALAGGAHNIERVDRLVQIIGRDQGLDNPLVDEIVARVDGWLERNRRKAA